MTVLPMTLLPCPFRIVVGEELLRVEVLTTGQRRADPHPDTSTRRSILPPPPLLSVGMQILEGPVLPALRRFRGPKNLSGGPMPPPK
jgi:hypothetical protein